jgi:hypothetical protein
MSYIKIYFPIFYSISKGLGIYRGADVEHGALWPDSPMIKGADPDIFDGISAAMRAAWISFVRTGKPAPDNFWSKYSVKDRMTMRFDAVISQAGDAAGVNWRGNLNPDGSIRI